MNRLFSHIVILLCAVQFIIVPDVIAAPKKSDEWKKHESLTNRLSSEWFRIGILQNDLDDIRDVFNDLLDFEIYPQSVTGLSDEDIVNIDRALEEAQKSRASIQTELNSLKSPLADDIEILREMAAKQAVESMFDVLIEGDMMRISELIKVKHKIDDLRENADSLLTLISTKMKIEIPKEESKYSEVSDFIEILTANLGLYSEIFYEKMNRVKTQLSKRAGKDDLKRMYNVEIHQIKKVIDSRQYRIADRKLLSMLQRYGKGLNTDELYTLIAKTKFGLKSYYEAIDAANKVQNSGRFTNKKELLLVQSWYALEDYEQILKWKNSADLFKFNNEERNFLIWLITESEIKISPDSDHAKLMELIDIEYKYAIHVLHAVARSYYINGQPEVAIPILEKATSNNAPADPIELTAFEKAKSTKAKILFEMEDYAGSLEAFFSLINSQQFFEEALFGMAWCYIKQNSYTKAEATLKKLINQSPESTHAAEAMLTMARRFINKAQHEWDKILYLSSEEDRVYTALQRLNYLKNSTVSEQKREKAIKAEKDLNALYSELKNEKRVSPSQIERLYKQALTINEIVAKNYETGSFKEESFSEQREVILHKLDSLTFLIVNSNKENGKTLGRNLKGDILKIKAVVKKSDIVKTEFLLDQYRWRVASIDWKKKNLSDTLRTANQNVNSTDSLTRVSALSDKKRIKNEIDSLVDLQSKLFSTHYSNLTERCINLLKTELAPKDESFIRYNLGELYYKKENLKFSEDFAKFEVLQESYDSLYTLFGEGKIDTLPLEPPTPKLSHNKSIEQFKTSIINFPKDTLIAAHRYSLAWCYNDLSLLDSAVSHMTIVANKHTQSSYAPQAWMFLGEYNFDNAKLADAVASYKNVMRYPESRWFDNALYKLAWTQYRLSNPEKAISSFLALVDLGKGIKGGKALLESESIDYIAISFSESDVTGEKGLERARIFCRKLNDAEKGTKILHRLASVYEEQGRFKMAVKSFKTLLSMYPNYKENPKVESDLIAVLSRDLDLEESNKLKMEYFEKYNRKSEWAKKQNDKNIIAVADSSAAIQLYDASIAYHRIALEKNDTTEYNKALDAYKQFIHYYPKASKTNECHYNLAEILFSTGKYLKAAEEYIAVSKRYPDSKYKETAAWNAIVASQTLLKLEKEGK